jgi:hypothetical protein
MTPLNIIGSKVCPASRCSALLGHVFIISFFVWTDCCINQLRTSPEVFGNFFWRLESIIEQGHQLHSMNHIASQPIQVILVRMRPFPIFPILQCHLKRQFSYLPALFRATLKPDGYDGGQTSNTRANTSSDSSGNSNRIHNVIAILVGYVIGSVITLMLIMWWYMERSWFVKWPNPENGAACGAWLGHVKGSYNINELFAWYCKQNDSDYTHDIVPVHVASLDVGNVEQLPKMLLQTPASGSPVELSKSGILVKDVAPGKTSLYEKITKPFRAIHAIFHKRMKWPNYDYTTANARRRARLVFLTTSVIMSL